MVIQRLPALPCMQKNLQKMTGIVVNREADVAKMVQNPNEIPAALK